MSEPEVRVFEEIQSGEKFFKNHGNFRIALKANI